MAGTGAAAAAGWQLEKMEFAGARVAAAAGRAAPINQKPAGPQTGRVVRLHVFAPFHSAPGGTGSPIGKICPAAGGRSAWLARLLVRPLATK